MCIFVQSVKLRSWYMKVVFENQTWSLKSPIKLVAIFCMNPDINVAGASLVVPCAFLYNSEEIGVSVT